MLQVRKTLILMKVNYTRKLLNNFNIHIHFNELNINVDYLMNIKRFINFFFSHDVRMDVWRILIMDWM